MLTQAYASGASDAYLRFGIKTAAPAPAAVEGLGAKAVNFAKDIPGHLWEGAKSVPRMMVGHPKKLWTERNDLFSKGKVLNPTDAFWPSVERGAPSAENPKGSIFPKIMGWGGRLNTLGMGYGAYKALRGQAGDPNEGRLTNTLSSLGNAAGWGFGFPVGGMLGAPLLAQAGSSIGKGIGHLLGSRPKPPNFRSFGADAQTQPDPYVPPGFQ